MTYLTYLESLRKIASEKQIKVVKADEEITNQGNGFVDISIFGNYQKAHNEWQIALNNITGLLSFISQNGLNLNDEIAIPEK
ncbi:hypothetical protein [Mucilaginibacter sp.]|uniref:hypothetical protein n=1 Tax=Mucilaginibacter sp. TaxID=1882438 RepID=UPI0025F43E01|nr:hypothetical protein [Mucilaginibacter sp.]